MLVRSVPQGALLVRVLVLVLVLLSSFFSSVLVVAFRAVLHVFVLLLPPAALFDVVDVAMSFPDVAMSLPDMELIGNDISRNRVAMSCSCIEFAGSFLPRMIAMIVRPSSAATPTRLLKSFSLPEVPSATPR